MNTAQELLLYQICTAKRGQTPYEPAFNTAVTTALTNEETLNMFVDGLKEHVNGIGNNPKLLTAETSWQPDFFIETTSCVLAVENKFEAAQNWAWRTIENQERYLPQSSYVLKTNKYDKPIIGILLNTGSWNLTKWTKNYYNVYTSEEHAAVKENWYNLKTVTLANTLLKTAKNEENALFALMLASTELIANLPERTVYDRAVSNAYACGIDLDVLVTQAGVSLRQKLLLNDLRRKVWTTEALSIAGQSFTADIDKETLSELITEIINEPLPSFADAGIAYGTKDWEKIGQHLIYNAGQLS